ncbi:MULTISPECIES: LysR family transcriptional regulator [Microbacterium]|uniref:LysR family transcriptional regulator n=1 Tax=Microbacterium TaxID=33882 RepID=UPI00217D774C|nr:MULTISPECIES: LysR substrate-binding domain-containing protein [Microbacterium]UWF77279.1 LysR family transcriptional regulator [Microbacterium neungamense]WCM55436.1 LysR family transcriptional regulator [Microbacterium sp. EF45047]
MLDLRQLIALRAVAEHGSVLAAADALDWSQPTVAHHLRGLERVTGAPVVASSRAGTRLTPAGRLWLPHAVAILDRADRARAEVATALADGRRRLRLGIFPTAAARLLPGLVHTLTDAGYRPEVVEGEMHELTELLERLALDAAVVFARADEPHAVLPGLRRRPLFTERFSLIVPAGHPLAGTGARRLRDFCEDRWILGTSEADPGDRALIAAARTEGFAPEVGPRSDDYRVVAAYVAEGLGIALVPELALPGPADRGEDVAVVELRRPLSREIALLTLPTLDEALVELIARTAVAGGDPGGTRAGRRRV